MVRISTSARSSLRNSADFGSACTGSRDDRAAVAHYNRTAALQAGSPKATFRIVRQDTGETRWIVTQGRAVMDRDGVAVRRIGTFRDITEQHEMRLALRRALHR